MGWWKSGLYFIYKKTKQRLLIVPAPPTEKNPISTIGVCTYFSGNPTNETFELTITLSEIVVSALGVKEEDAKKQIRDFIQSEYTWNMEAYKNLTFAKSLNRDKGVLQFGIITDVEESEEQ